MDNRLNRNKDITVLHNGRTGEWVDLNRDSKIKSTLQKLEWLQNTIHKCIAMDQSRHHDIPTTTAIRNDVALLEQLEEKLRLGRLITRSDMSLCNVILKRIKSFYRIDIDWRGNIESTLKQKSDKINLLYSWIEW